MWRGCAARAGELATEAASSDAATTPTVVRRRGGIWTRLQVGSVLSVQSRDRSHGTRGCVPIPCPRVPTLKDLDAYLARIGHDGPVTLAGLHRSHATSIPFENFESSAGRAVSLEPSHLEEKLVARRRGGYCFEQNLLFMA